MRIATLCSRGVLLLGAMVWGLASSSIGFARVPKLRSCGSHLPGIKAPSWGAARHRLGPAGIVAGTLCRGNSAGDVSVGARLHNLSIVRALSSEADAISARSGALPPGCTPDSGPRVVARFAYASGHTVSVSAELGSCLCLTTKGERG
jgi:hypothetical protein